MVIDFVIVLLHYNTIEDTHKLISSIKNQLEFQKGRIHIVVVDNASPNNSGHLLEKYYKNDSSVSIILQTENLGFAKGNNIGFTYSKKMFNPKFIVLSNTDILLNSNNFFSRIEKIYDDTNFGVLGPNIEKPTSIGTIYQNPKKINTKIDVVELKRDIFQINYNKLKANFKLRIKKFFKVRNIYKNKLNYGVVTSEPTIRYTDSLILHGAFLIFSTKYIQKFPEGLYPDTYMYGEEHFISYQCQENEIPMVFDPSISVTHLEGRATLSERNEIQRNIFLRKQATKSLKKLISIMKASQK